ncbi:MAG: four helix bundle protein [Bdellovibrionota bacterium]
MLKNFDAYQLAKQFYQECKPLRVPRFLQDQLLRASSSVVLNLAEGSGKRTFEDQRRFYSIAFGSLRECRAILEMEQIEDPGINQLADQLSAILYVLSRKTSAKTPKTGLKNQTDSDTDSATLHRNLLSLQD